MWRMQEDEPAPLATKCIFMTPYGSAVIGHWYVGCEFICWCPLPKLTDDQKARVARCLDGDRVQGEEFSKGHSEMQGNPLQATE